MSSQYSANIFISKMLWLLSYSISYITTYIYHTLLLGKTYKQGSYIPVIIDITANHQGYFIFKLCPNNDIFQDPQQNCFDQRPLWVGGGDPNYNHTRFPINDYETGLRMVYVRLPMDVTCEQCIMQWSYVAGKRIVLFT